MWPKSVWKFLHVSIRSVFYQLTKTLFFDFFKQKSFFSFFDFQKIEIGQCPPDAAESIMLCKRQSVRTCFFFVKKTSSNTLYRNRENTSSTGTEPSGKNSKTIFFLFIWFCTSVWLHVLRKYTKGEKKIEIESGSYAYFKGNKWTGQNQNRTKKKRCCVFNIIVTVDKLILFRSASYKCLYILNNNVGSSCYNENNWKVCERHIITKLCWLPVHRRFRWSWSH